MRSKGSPSFFFDGKALLSNKKTVVSYTITVNDKYSYSPSHKFFVAANLIACSFLAIYLLLFCIMEKTSESINDFFFFHDVVIMHC